MTGEGVCAVFLLAMAVSVLFLYENSTATRLGVSLLLGGGLAWGVVSLLPQEWIDAIPRIGLPGRAGVRDARLCLAVALGSAACYPAVAFRLYPLRDKLLAAVERRRGGRG